MGCGVVWQATANKGLRGRGWQATGVHPGQQACCRGTRARWLPAHKGRDMRGRGQGLPAHKRHRRKIKIIYRGVGFQEGWARHLR